jgi:catechol 2,3-dioxygenase-like lactoylglutathione lyase family enzyme
MLGDKQSIATLAVKDLKAATRFYEDKLGFVPVDREGDEVVTYRSGPSVFNVYHSKYAGTNKATALTWNVGDDLDDVLRDLKAKGIKFEHYDNMPGVTREGDVHKGGDMRVAWFKDPDGNILNLVG